MSHVYSVTDWSEHPYGSVACLAEFNATHKNDEDFQPVYLVGNVKRGEHVELWHLVYDGQCYLAEAPYDGTDVRINSYGNMCRDARKTLAATPPVTVYTATGDGWERVQYLSAPTPPQSDTTSETGAYGRLTFITEGDTLR